MRAITIPEYGQAGVLTMSEVELPTLRDGEVRIRVIAAGVNRPDVFQRMGLYQPPPDASALPGLEVAGVIESISERTPAGQAHTWKVGDPVCALVNGGGYAEYVSVPAGQCLPVPDGLSFVEAAALPETFFTVWSNVYDRAQLKAGESLLVHGGSSGIGTTAIQIASALGSTVYVTAGTDEKCRACIDLGATAAINYRTSDFEQELKATVPQGINVILDMVGGDYVQKNLALAAVDGRLVSIAFLRGSKAEVDLMPVMRKRLTLTGSTLRPQSAEAKAALASALFDTVWPLIGSGQIKPRIAQTFELSEAVEAHRLMESSAHIGKIVLKVSSQ